jgi:hypothetical protein
METEINNCKRPLYGYWTDYAYVVVLSEDCDGNQKTMEFVSDTEANEYFNN